MAKVGLQLYTVKDEVARDLRGTLSAVSRMGYDGVEFAGIPDIPAPELSKLLVDLNLQIAGIVSPMSELSDRHSFERAMEYNVTLGSPTVLFPWLDDQYRGSGDAYKRTGELLETIGQAIRSKGLHFLYHTHGYEFDSYAGRTGLDILLQQTTAEAVGVEIDTFWVEHGGVDALVLYNELADRCLNIHFKDSKDKNDWCDTEVGDGVIGVADIIHAAYGKPTEWFVVEQEKFDRPPLDSAKISCLNLRRLIKENYKL